MERRMHLNLVPTLVLGVLLTSAAPASAAQKATGGIAAVETVPDPRELLDRYRKAVTGWDRSVSMHIEYDHSMAYQGRDFRHWKYDLQHRRDGDRCEWFGHCQFEGKFDDNAYSFNEELRDLVTEDYYLCYSRRDVGREETPVMGTEVKEHLFGLQVQSRDGNFLQGRTGGIGNATHQAQVMYDSNEVRYVGQETIAGTACTVVEARTKYGTFTVWLAPEKGYNALKSVWRKSGRDILRENIRIEEQGITDWTETVDAVEVQKIDGVFVPVAGRLTRYAKWADGKESEDHTTVQRREIVLHPDFQALGTFQIVLPEGTEVRLADNSQRTFRWSEGKFTPDLDKHLMKSLLGKPLPGLEGIHVDGNPAAAGKMLVVCFFDMQQRPSRNCLVQLAGKAELLAQQGAVLLGIQATKVEQDRLREWLRENNIRVPVGLVSADEEETHCAWGVQSLPWLILTDRSHVVRAEGFDLSDLQARMDAVKPLPAAQEQKRDAQDRSPNRPPTVSVAASRGP
jgi:hypothetical protein